MRHAHFTYGILAAATMFVAANHAKAAVLYWDADGSSANGISGGSGSWNLNSGNKVWFDPTNSTYFAWTVGNEAVFEGTGGAVAVSINMNPSKVTVNTAGYTFTGTLAPQTVGDSINILANAQFSALSPASGVNTVIASGKILTLTGGSPRKITGGSVSVTSGNLSIGNATLNTAVTQSGGTASAAAAGNTVRIGDGVAGSWTLSNSTAAINLSSTSNLDVGRSAGGNGSLAINAGTVSITGGAGLHLGVSANSSTVSNLSVAGGTLTVTGNNGAGVNSVLYITDAAAGKATFAISDGTATIDTIQFGRTGTASSGGTGAVNVSGGSLYIGSGGIVLSTLAENNATITLSGGVVGARADWSSSMAMSITGPATIKAADAADISRNISLAGSLSGNGGSLTKVGTGTLLLSGNNTYNGGTTISAGKLLANNNTLAQSSTGTGAVSVGGGASLGGTGRVGGAVTVAAGSSDATRGAIDLVDSTIGTLSLGSTLSLASASNASLLNLEYNGSSWDKVSVIGGVNTGAGNVLVSLTSLGNATNGIYDIVTGSSVGTNFLFAANNSTTFVSGAKKFTLLNTGTAEQVKVQDNFFAKLTAGSAVTPNTVTITGASNSGNYDFTPVTGLHAVTGTVNVTASTPTVVDDPTIVLLDLGDGVNDPSGSTLSNILNGLNSIASANGFTVSATDEILSTYNYKLPAGQDWDVLLRFASANTTPFNFSWDFAGLNNGADVAVTAVGVVPEPVVGLIAPGMLLFLGARSRKRR